MKVDIYEGSTSIYKGERKRQRRGGEMNILIITGQASFKAQEE